MLKFRNREDEMKNLFGITALMILLALPAKAVTVSFADDYKNFKNFAQSACRGRVPITIWYQNVSSNIFGTQEFLSWGFCITGNNIPLIFTFAQGNAAPGTFTGDFPNAIQISSPSGNGVFNVVE